MTTSFENGSVQVDIENQLLSSALRYAELGYPVFPCIPGGKSPLTNHGFHDASTDPEQIEQWWADNPAANIGLPTAGLFVVDIDGFDNQWPHDPEKEIELAGGAVAITPRGGRHYIFRQPDGANWKNTTSKIAPHVDTRADGGYIVVAPSKIKNNSYQWLEGSTLDYSADQLIEPPEWVVDLLNQPATGGNLLSTATSDGNQIPSGQRNDTLARLAGVMRRSGMGEKEILAALLQTNKDRCSPQLGKPEVERIAESVSRYEPDQITVATIENHYAQDWAMAAEENNASSIPNPGLLSVELLRVPGFISDVMDYCLKTAPYPNQVLAFCGAMALQSFLAGRKVRDPGDNRTNLYLLGLANSASGKDWPRQLNVKILQQVGMLSCLCSSFASGEGLQDALGINPAMLFQPDEMDGMLQAINKSKDARHEAMLGALLTLYSSANSVFPIRRKAGQEAAESINQPCLSMFGTAIPKHYYEALSPRMLTNGFFSRTMIFDAGERSSGQQPTIIDVPEEILAVAKYWADFRPGTGNLSDWSPHPRIVSHTDAAKHALSETRKEADREYKVCERNDDVVGMAVWGRVTENACKLALIYAVSEDHKDSEISENAVTWAKAITFHQARRMLFMADSHVHDNPFHGECQKALTKLREAPGQRLTHSSLLKKMKNTTRQLSEIITALVETGQIIASQEGDGKYTTKYYSIPLLNQ